MRNDQTFLKPLAVAEREAARLLGVSGRTVFRLRKEGKITAVKIGTGMQSRVLYPVASLEKFLDDSAAQKVTR